MNHIVIMLSLLLAAVLQTVWPAWESMGSSRLPLFVSVVLYFTLTRSTLEAVMVALLAGLIQDSLSGIPLGYSSFVFVLMTAFLDHFKDLLFAYQVVTQVFFGALACCLTTLSLYLLLRYGGHVEAMPGLLVRKFLGSMILGMIVVPLTCRTLVGFDRSLGTGIGDRYA